MGSVGRSGSGAQDNLFLLRLHAQECVNEFMLRDGQVAYGYSELILELQEDENERQKLEMLCGPNGYTVYKLMLLKRASFKGRLKRLYNSLLGRGF